MHPPWIPAIQNSFVYLFILVMNLAITGNKSLSTPKLLIINNLLKIQTAKNKEQTQC